MTEYEKLTLEDIEQAMEDEPNNLDWYGLKFSMLIVAERYEELIDCIDTAIIRTKLRYEVLIKFRHQIKKKMQGSR